MWGPSQWIQLGSATRVLKGSIAKQVLRWVVEMDLKRQGAEEGGLQGIKDLGFCIIRGLKSGC